ncbi:MAG TPA: hypothetical protein VKA21_09320 [Candidatus Binatia bacterium]|nr:hypothetical protein [Candidatus Binatia bacterium]
MGWMKALVVAVVALGCSHAVVTGPPQRIRSFGAADKPIATSEVAVADGGWRVAVPQGGAVRLFEVPQPTGLESTVLTYRARMKSENVAGKAYLEMWVRVPGRGEFFSRGLAQPLTGTSEWATYEIPFFLSEKGVRADLVKLNVAFEGAGTVWIKDVELLKASLAG